MQMHFPSAWGWSLRIAIWYGICTNGSNDRFFIFLQLGWINDKILLYIHDIFRNTPFAALIRMYHPFRKVWGYYLLSQRAFFLQARTQYLFLEICSKKEYETDSVSFVLFIMERFILFYQSSFSADTNKRYPKEIQSLLLILYSPF